MSSSPSPEGDPSSDDVKPVATAADTAQPPPATPEAEAKSSPHPTPAAEAKKSPPPSPPSPAAHTPPADRTTSTEQTPKPPPPSPPAQTPPPSPPARTPPPSPPAQTTPPSPPLPPPSSPPPATHNPPPPQLSPPPKPPSADPVEVPPQPASPEQPKPSPAPPADDVPQPKPDVPETAKQNDSPATNADVADGHAALSPPTAIPATTTPDSDQTPPSSAWTTTAPSPPANAPLSSTGAQTDEGLSSPHHAASASRPSDPSSSTPHSSQGHPLLLGVTFGCLAIALVTIVVFAVLWRRRRRRRESDLQHKNSPSRASLFASPGMEHLLGIYFSPEVAEAGGVSRPFAYEELARITDGFSPELLLGEGGFGSVYKGVTADGLPVAVKQLKAGSGQGEREFQAEVETISRIHHRHLVSLVGYCIADRHRLLVYEFIANDTLGHHLHGKGLPVLDWANRMKIAIGSARGLAYLHEDCRPRIIHRDIKSANILLDESFDAKVADFGLARLTNDANTHVSTRVMGTFGYLAPEYASSGKLTDRSDVYSFGVVLLELITGRESIDLTLPSGDGSLVEWARPHLIRVLKAGGNFEELVDPKLENNFNQGEMLQMIEAAAACVRHSAPNRPRMLQVLRALECGRSLPDLSNGKKFGESAAYSSSEYAADVENLRKMIYESDSSSFDCDPSGDYDTESSSLCKFTASSSSG